jgi:class 3 adenylate cyclase
VHTAYAAVGNFGAEGRLVYGAVGPALAVADLAAHAAPPASVVLTHPTRMLCGETFRLEAAGQLQAPGAAEPIALHRVLG